ncbi:MAG TPA: GvpL/GvpF family gas vesicle protein [Vicinamibacterales bacterium]|nr:GvpL/GvpF family gas vesicle protein [Vicinamibacterales bacterium]
MATSLTYVYCLVAASKRPQTARVRRGLDGASRPRAIEIDRGLFAIVADVPERQYGEAAINAHLSDLDWVSRAAVAHERVIEAFIDADALLPMKLFTIFSSDDRVVGDVRADRDRIARVIKRVSKHHEYGIRVVLERAVRAPSASARQAQAASVGAAYLQRKKAQRDAAVELAANARETVTELYDRLAARARAARRRPASELPVQGGPLLLDAAFLIPRGKARGFETAVARDARTLRKAGYGVVLTGPWPPYTFVQD